MSDRPTVLEAIVRGKVVAFDDREDHLTSLVLGVLAWVPPALGIARLLTLAVDADRRPLGWGENLERFELDLWPWWDLDEHVAGAEPDAVLEMEGRAGRTLLVIESKWHSGKSGSDERDQLKRQHANGLAEAERRHARLLGVLYVTTHLALPVADLVASRTAIEADTRLGRPRLGWVSWRDALSVLERAAVELRVTQPLVSRLAEDAAHYMRRAGLARYAGLPRPERVPTLPYRSRALAVPRRVPAFGACQRFETQVRSHSLTRG
jgi:hypothetical protein